MRNIKFSSVAFSTISKGVHTTFTEIQGDPSLPSSILLTRDVRPCFSNRWLPLDGSACVAHLDLPN